MLPPRPSWGSFVDSSAAGREEGLMKTLEFATPRSLPWASLFLRARPAPFAHFLASVFPCFRASQSNLHHPWLMIEFLRVLSSFCQCWSLANWEQCFSLLPCKRCLDRLFEHTLRSLSQMTKVNLRDCSLLGAKEGVYIARVPWFWGEGELL